MRFALPGERVQFPIELRDRPNAVSFEWIPLGELAPLDSARVVAGTINAPTHPGFYRLAVVNHGGRTIVDGMTLAVMVPFSDKQGSSLNGYKIGFYRGEKRGLDTERPRGFLQIAKRSGLVRDRGQVIAIGSVGLDIADLLTLFLW